MTQDEILKKVVNLVVQSLTDRDFVESLEVGGKWWDVYRFYSPKGPGLIALRLAPDGVPEIAAMKRTMSEVKAALAEAQN